VLVVNSEMDGPLISTNTTEEISSLVVSTLYTGYCQYCSTL